MENLRFYKGDTVRVKYFSNDDPEPEFGWCHPEMDKWSGQEFIISDIIGYRVYFENMSIEMNRWSWGLDMIEHVKCREPSVQETALWQDIIEKG